MYTLLTNINGIRFHNVYIYSKTLDQPKCKMLSNILLDIEGVQLFTFYKNEQVIEPEKALPNSRGKEYVDQSLLGEAQSYSRVRKNFCVITLTLSKKGGNKYKDIIKTLFPSGSGVSVKLQRHPLQ
ncbi:Uncharacterized protein FWK35_00015282 [Aphis craccivora]|uniref:Uncharacterized protein n=1 Tax=Aphis craccivora TaxID=307492 RepID=A0A6G0YC95_APHCR|nr:Uncharacterized protein FWK35_00015282 [Aphis craccivora]